jgi:D-beta-D-heptose 7-phosphate kinase/D-beta-D-heptose 1-phosphate adenosyltransferase
VTSFPDSALAAWLPRIADRSILVLGDVMLDRYVLGSVHRISPEAPIPVLHATGQRGVLGGAGNVAHNIAALGGRAVLVGVVGTDAAAAEIERLIAAQPRLHGALQRCPERPTTTKTRFMSASHQLLRVDEEVTTPLGEADAAAVLAAFTAALARAAAVVISDYAKGLLTDALLAAAIARARARGLAVVIDPKRTDFAAYAHAGVLTPNALELARATGLPVTGDAEAAAAAEVARARAAADAVLVKRSAKGLTLVRAGEPALHLPTRARAVADVSGAGDTVSATLALMLGAGAPLAEAARLANVAAGIAVSKPGTATVRPAELAEALRERAHAVLDDKIADLADALARIAEWRRQGLRVGFTNGCFDLIHPGHVRLLAAARAACDRLVVALNSDASVRRLKGPQRPVQNETARATVMASMASADLVLLFEQDTPEALIRAILPDVLFKGADYRLEEVVGADIVRAHGGQVVLIPLEQGHSTSATLRRIGASGG